MKRAGLRILNFDYVSLADTLLRESETSKTLLTYYNFSTAILINKSPLFYDVLKNDFQLHCDGVGVYFFSKLILGVKVEYNINGSNLYPVLIDKIKQLNRKIFLVFSSNLQYDSVKPAVEKYFKDYSKNVEFCIFEKGINKDLVNKINKFDPDVVFIGIGQPYQEYWISKNNPSLNFKLVVCSGSGLEFLLSQKKRAPIWMQKIGFEWLYRLFQEPKRLWKRYIFGIPIFVFNIIVIKVKLLFKKEST